MVAAIRVKDQSIDSSIEDVMEIGRTGRE